MPRAPKIQRWTDLLAALLRRHYPAPFEELARDVPAYNDPGQSQTARMRMFERDKDELRAFGVPIESVLLDDGETHAYRLAGADFYMPYLAFAAERGTARPSKVDRYGYRSLQSLTFEPDELTAMADAAGRLRALRDPALSAEVDSAIRKLAFDLPLDVSAPSDGVHVARPRDRVDTATFEQLGDALLRRKRVRFDYRTMSSDEVTRRNVEPYGLFFLDSHWYLAARDAEKDAIRNFRVSRISEVDVNSERSQSPDFAPPPEFDLRDHARSRQAWELGDASAVEAVVEFTRASGAATAAMALGDPVAGAPSRRRFQVRRADVFCRWVLSFAGDARVVAPATLREECRDLARRTREVYAS